MKKFIIPILIMFLASCSFLPAKSPIALQEVYNADTATIRLYEQIIWSTDKNYSTYQSLYSQIDDQISTILIVDSARLHNKLFLKDANDIKKRFTKYENQHISEVVLNNTELTVNEEEMHALFTDLENSEKNLN